MKMIRAIFADGVFKPFDPVELPEGTYVQIHALPVTPIQADNNPEKKLSAIFNILQEEQQHALDRQAAQRVDYRPEA